MTTLILQPNERNNILTSIYLSFRQDTRNKKKLRMHLDELLQSFATREVRTTLLGVQT